MPVTTFTVSAIDTGTDIFTATGHNQPAGTPVFISAGTTLPAGLTADAAPLNKTSILYYIASTNLTADAFSLVASKNPTTPPMAGNDGSGSIVNVTSAGSGTILLQLSQGLACMTEDWVQASGSVEISNVPLAVSLVVNGLASGSEVRITQADNDALLFVGAESGGQIQFSTKYKGAMNIEARKADATPFYKPWFGSATLSTTNLTVTAVQARED